MQNHQQTPPKHAKTIEKQHDALGCNVPLIPRKHRAYNHEKARPTWLHRGFTSYEQTERLCNSLLVKRISRLVSQGGSVGRHLAMTRAETDSADTQKPYAKTCLYPSPQPCYAKTCKNDMTEGSLEVKLPTTWTDEKQRWEESK